MTSHWNMFKSRVRSVIKRIGVFFGIEQTEYENIAVWNNRIEHRIQEGEYGISLHKMFFKRSDRKYKKLTSQVEQALSEVTSGENIEYDELTKYELDCSESDSDDDFVEDENNGEIGTILSVECENTDRKYTTAESANSDYEPHAIFVKEADQTDSCNSNQSNEAQVHLKSTVVHQSTIYYAESGKTFHDCIMNETNNSEFDQLSEIFSEEQIFDLDFEDFTVNILGPLKVVAVKNNVQDKNNSANGKEVKINSDTENRKSEMKSNSDISTNVTGDTSKSYSAGKSDSEDSSSVTSDKLTNIKPEVKNNSDTEDTGETSRIYTAGNASIEDSSVVNSDKFDNTKTEVTRNNDNSKDDTGESSRSFGSVTTDSVGSEGCSVVSNDKSEYLTENRKRKRKNSIDSVMDNTRLRSGPNVAGSIGSEKFSLVTSDKLEIKTDADIQSTYIKNELGKSENVPAVDIKDIDITVNKSKHSEITFTDEGKENGPKQKHPPDCQKSDIDSTEQILHTKKTLDSNKIKVNSTDNDEQNQQNSEKSCVKKMITEHASTEHSPYTDGSDVVKIKGILKMSDEKETGPEHTEKHVGFESSDEEVVDVGETITESHIRDINPNSVLNQQFEHSQEDLTESDLAYGKEAYHHYKLFTEIEKKVRIRELEESKTKIKEIYEHNIQKIDDIMKLARAYYMDPTGKAAKEWRELWKGLKSDSGTKQKFPKSITDIRVRLSEMPVYWPFFTVFIILAQLVSFGVICGLGGLTYIGLQPKLELQNGIKTFIGTETIHKWLPPNIWIGPSELYMISVGASFAPCMREDYGIQIDYTKLNYSSSNPLGCCEVQSRNTAGTTTEEECRQFTNGVGNWTISELCSERPSGQNHIEHNMKPCCVNTKGTCRLTTHTHCTFIGGIFYRNGPEHCTQVNCLSAICGFGGFKAKTNQPWLPDSPSQSWRFLLSLFYHHGIIHTLLVVLVQAIILRQIEHSAGWFRVMIIYILAGVGGLLAATIFTPYSPHVGGTGALFGMVGVTLVELIQFWKIVKRPVLELCKILLALVFFLVSGTLPYINNFSIIFGFIIGLLSGCAFLPYITFGHWHKRCRIFLVILTVPLLILLYFVLLYVFYKVQTLEGCTVCNHINCIPYTDKMCDNSLWSS